MSGVSPGITPFPSPEGVDIGGSDPALCYYRWRTAVGRCPLCAARDGDLLTGEDLAAGFGPPLHRHCRCWVELDWCDQPDDPPLLPPEDPPGPGPF